jgi:hypothetical protein
MPACIAVSTVAPEGDGARRSTLVCSVDQAINVMDSLPARKRRLPRWRKARQALRRARDNPQDPALAGVAASAFRAALVEEEWLP